MLASDPSAPAAGTVVLPARRAGRRTAAPPAVDRAWTRVVPARVRPAIRQTRRLPSWHRGRWGAAVRTDPRQARAAPRPGSSRHRGVHRLRRPLASRTLGRRGQPGAARWGSAPAGRRHCRRRRSARPAVPAAQQFTGPPVLEQGLGPSRPARRRIRLEFVRQFARHAPGCLGRWAAQRVGAQRQVAGHAISRRTQASSGWRASVKLDSAGRARQARPARASSGARRPGSSAAAPRRRHGPRSAGRGRAPAAWRRLPAPPHCPGHAHRLLQRHRAKPLQRQRRIGQAGFGRQPDAAAVGGRDRALHGAGGAGAERPWRARWQVPAPGPFADGRRGRTRPRSAGPAVAQHRSARGWPLPAPGRGVDATGPARTSSREAPHR